MKLTQTTYKYNDKTNIRAVVYENGERYFVLNDIFGAAGYKAPRKVSERCSHKKKRVVASWKSDTSTRNGKAMMWGVTYSEYLRMIDHYEFRNELTEFLDSIEKQTNVPPVIRSLDCEIEINESTKQVIKLVSATPHVNTEMIGVEPEQTVTVCNHSTEADHSIDLVKDMNLQSEELADLVTNIVLNIIKLMKYANVNQ